MKNSSNLSKNIQKKLEKSRFWLQRLSPAMSDNTRLETIKVLLKMARKDGLNPKELFKVALKTRQSDRTPPEESAVFPL